MGKKIHHVIVRRLTGPRKTALKIGLRAQAFYLIVILVGGIAGLWLNDKFEKLEHEHAFNLLHHL